MPDARRLGAANVMIAGLETHLDAFGAAAAGALLGSLSAFGLGLVTERLRRLAKRHSALLETQYALMSQWTIIESIRRDHLEKWRNDPQRFAKLPLYYAPGVPLKVRFSEITFITSTDDADLLQQIHIAEQKFDACMETLRLRNERLEEFYRDSSITRQNFDFETGRSTITAEPYKFFFIRKLTDNLYEQADRALPKFVAEIKSLEKFIKKNFPGRNALRMADLDEKPKSQWGRKLARLFGRKNLTRIAFLMFVAVSLLISLGFFAQMTRPSVLSLSLQGLWIAALLLLYRIFDRWLAE